MGAIDGMIEFVMAVFTSEDPVEHRATRAAHLCVSVLLRYGFLILREIPVPLCAKNNLAA